MQHINTWHHISLYYIKYIFMKKNLLILSALLIIVPASFIACSKDDNGTTTLNVRMTDNPIDLRSVNVDVLQVRVKLGNDTTLDASDNGWVDLQTNARIYDLLRLQNGLDTALATGVVPTGYIKEIRFILGPNNSVIDTFGVSHPLTIPSGAESGLKIKVNQKMNATLQTLLMDFDAALSIQKEITGYKLRPVIKVK